MNNIDTEHENDHCIEKRGDVGIAPYGWDGGRIAPYGWDGDASHIALKKRGDVGIAPYGWDGGAALPSDARIPKVIRSLKTLVAKDSGASVFQKSYVGHIIRHEEDYLMKWNYMDANPLGWADDKCCEAMTPI